MKERAFDVVILSSVDWDAAWQRHQAFAASWARAGHKVFFVENMGFREPGLRDLPRVAGRLRRATRRNAYAAPRGVAVVSPLVLPPTRRLFRETNAALLAPRLADLLHDRGLRRKPVVIAYLPTATTLALLDQLSPALVVYDCVDNFYGLPSPPPDLAATEAALMARAGLVLTTSRTLYADKKGKHAHILELHHGVSPAFFLSPRKPGPVRRLCYFGTLWSAIDYAPIRALAEAGFDVELVGPVKETPPALPPSVRLRGPVPHAELPALLAGFDALLLPYVDDAYNRGVIPAKTYECLATGRPVLASPLPALEGLSSELTVCRSPEGWVEAARAVERDTDAARERRVRAARAHAEDAMFKRLSAAVEAALSRAPVPVPAPKRRALLSGLGWIGLLYGAAKASTLVAQVVAGRLLGPEEYGRANLAVAAAAYLQIVPMLGFPLAASKLVSEERDEERRNRLVSTALAAFAVWAALGMPLLFAARHPIERALGLPPELLALAGLLASMTALQQVLASPLLGLKRFAHRGLVEAVYGFSIPAFLALLIFFLGPVHQAMILAFCASLFAASVYALWCLRRHLAPVFEPRFIGAVGRYASVATLNLLAAACVLAPARFLLHAHASAHEVGLFSAYFTATVQVSLAFLYILQSVLVPMASSPEGQRETWGLLRRWGPPALLACWLVFCAAAIAALTLFGRSYRLDLGWAAAFAGAAVLVLAHGTASALYSARDFSGLRVSVAGSLVAGLGNAALAAWLIPTRGVLGSAEALLLSFTAGLVFYALYGALQRS